MIKEQIISSILGGHSVATHASYPGQFLTSVSVDPETQVNSAILKPGSIITPIRYEKFTGSAVSGAPMWLVTNPKNQNTYSYNSDGELISYDSALATETVIGTPTSGVGNGMAYYNNYIYLTTPTNVSRYGPLNNSPALTNTVWTGATLGSLTALNNTSYPGVRNVIYPNHAMHAHVDNKLYICDFGGTATTDPYKGKGLIHYIRTTRVADEGDTNDTSTYNALDLPFGYAPFDIESYGVDLAIVASQVSSSTAIRQGNAALFLWDTFSPTFYRQIPIPEPLVTSIINHRGQLYIWAGSIDFGYKLYRYSGGYDLDPLETFMEGSPALAGAVDTSGNRIMWGSYITYPATAAVVMSRGYNNSNLPSTAINSIGRVTGTGTLPIISSLKQVQQAQRVAKPLIGWRTDTPAEYGIDRTSGSATFNTIFRLDVEEVGTSFTIKEIKIPLAAAVSVNVTITPTIYVDDETASFGATNGISVINNTNFSKSERLITIKPERVRGENNFYLELAVTGTTSLPVNLPIKIKYETEETSK